MGRTTRTRTRPPLNPTGTSPTEKIVALSKRQLEIRLSKLAMIEDPKLSLEQYPISAVAASELLYIAG
ncbi:MAG TPA: hypothetical protein VE177_03930, partial [Candidatus Binatus sp.]|nr:hypothetical protein [Candidatus Binatus sp.]